MSEHFFDFPAELPPGAWAEKRRLAAAIRELIAQCVTSEASAEVLAAASAQVRGVVAQLGGHPSGTLLDAFTNKTVGDITRFADRQTMIGLCNPISPPMTMSDDGQLVTAYVNFGPAFEGAPGCVHGGLLAAAFDQVLGYLNVSRKVGAMTATLNLQYRRPTPINKPLRMEARIERVEGKKRWVSGKMFSGDELTVEAEGLFIALEAGKVDKIVARVRTPEDT